MPRLAQGGFFLLLMEDSSSRSWRILLANGGFFILLLEASSFCFWSFSLLLIVFSSLQVIQSHSIFEARPDAIPKVQSRDSNVSRGEAQLEKPTIKKER